CQGACKGVGGYTAPAMQTIVFGRASTACGDATSFYTAGMCDVFNRITPANVRIVYTQPAAPAGLGFAGRPGGPVPTIKISLQNMPFRFFFLGDLLGFRNIQIPCATTTMTSEDLYSCAPARRKVCSDIRERGVSKWANFRSIKTRGVEEDPQPRRGLKDRGLPARVHSTSPGGDKAMRTSTVIILAVAISMGGSAAYLTRSWLKDQTSAAVQPAGTIVVAAKSLAYGTAM